MSPAIAPEAPTQRASGVAIPLREVRQETGAEIETEEAERPELELERPPGHVEEEHVPREVHEAHVEEER